MFIKRRGKKNLVKHKKVSKYYDHDCPKNFILFFMSLLTAPIVKYSHVFGPRPNLKGFQYQIWTSAKRSEKLSSKTSFSPFLLISCPNLG